MEAHVVKWFKLTVERERESSERLEFEYNNIFFLVGGAMIFSIPYYIYIVLHSRK